MESLSIRYRSLFMIIFQQYVTIELSGLFSLEGKDEKGQKLSSYVEYYHAYNGAQFSGCQISRALCSNKNLMIGRTFRWIQISTTTATKRS